MTTVSKNQLISLIERLPVSAQVTTYYYLQHLTKTAQDELHYEEYSFVSQQGMNKEEPSWINAFMEFHLDS